MGQKDRLNELQNRLSELFDWVDDYYSQTILEELVNRINTTIIDFNSEFKSLVEELNNKQEKQSSISKISTAS